MQRCDPRQAAVPICENQSLDSVDATTPSRPRTWGAVVRGRMVSCFELRGAAGAWAGWQILPPEAWLCVSGLQLLRNQTGGVRTHSRTASPSPPLLGPGWGPRVVPRPPFRGPHITHIPAAPVPAGIQSSGLRPRTTVIREGFELCRPNPRALGVAALAGTRSTEASGGGGWKGGQAAGKGDDSSQAARIGNAAT